MPRRGDGLLKIGIARRPAQLGLRFRRAGNQTRRIAGAARSLYRLYRAAGPLFAELNDLAHRKAGLAAQIEEVAAPSGAQSVQRQRMRLGQIDDVNVVADTGSVPGV